MKQTKLFNFLIFLLLFQTTNLFASIATHYDTLSKNETGSFDLYKLDEKMDIQPVNSTVVRVYNYNSWNGGFYPYSVDEVFYINPEDTNYSIETSSDYKKTRIFRSKSNGFYAKVGFIDSLEGDRFVFEVTMNLQNQADFTDSLSLENYPPQDFAVLKTGYWDIELFWKKPPVTKKQLMGYKVYSAERDMIDTTAEVNLDDWICILECGPEQTSFHTYTDDVPFDYWNIVAVYDSGTSKPLKNYMYTPDFGVTEINQSKLHNKVSNPINYQNKNFKIKLGNESSLSFSIFNMEGQKIYIEKFYNLSKGYHSLKINKVIASGCYIAQFKFNKKIVKHPFLYTK